MATNAKDAPRPTSKRAEYLLGSRRVRLSDILDADLLRVGEKLIFTRPRLGEEHTASITAKGLLKLDDGRIFPSPSRAASAAVGGGSFDGWQAWTVERTGELLDAVRQRLLAQSVDSSEINDVSQSLFDRDVADGPDRVDYSQDAALRRQELLREARDRAEAGAPVELSVRELMTWWSAETRSTAAMEQAAIDLGNHGLITVPDFRKVTIDARIALQLPPLDSPTAQEDLSSTPYSSANIDTSDDDQPLDGGLTIGNLASSSGGLVSVSPQSTLDQAMTLMLLNDFSQVGVLNGRRTVLGAISWKSIAQARHLDVDAPLSAAITPASVVPFDQELIDTLPLLASDDFVFVSDSTNAISGIVTAADVVAAYGELATPFFLIGELDRLLRQVIRQNFELEDVVASCDPARSRKIKGFDSLTMGDYASVLASPDRWQELDWSLDRKLFSERLDEMRLLRNDVMHFNPDPVPLGSVAKLRNLITVLRRFGAE